MGGGGSQQSTQFQSQTRDPWNPAIPALNTALGGAMDAYRNTYNGPQVAGMDPNVTSGQDQILANSRNGLVSGNATDALQSLRGILGNGGFNPFMNQGADSLRSGMSGLDSVSQNLNPYASGQYLKQGGNPYLDSTIGSAMKDAAQGVNAQFSSAGRYGSGANADALASRLGTIATNARMQDYNQQQQNQLQANSMLQQLAGLRGTLGQGLAGIGQQGVNNLQGAGGALSSLGTAENTDAANQMGVGSQRMDYAQRLIDAANQAPWAKVGNLAQIASGIGGLGGTSTGFSQGQQSMSGGGLGSILGGGLAGLGGLGNLFGGLGKFMGAGGFAALFSDERLKENIKRVGKTNDGQNVYQYNYKDDPLKRTTLGLMAQEVEKRKPEAVTRDPFSGFKMVDYAKAMEPA